jgi:FkbM family methyltransferase
MIQLEYRGKQFYFEESPTAQMLINEIFSDNYKVFERGVESCMEFLDGDVVLDLGANEGMFSIMIAKLFPGVKVISLEPVPKTFYQMIRNIGLNGVTNIRTDNVGVGKGECLMNVSNIYSGGSSLVDTYNPAITHQVKVNLCSIDEIFNKYGLNRVKLLKVDIEGSEYEALYDCKKLGQVDHMVAEFHMNTNLQNKGYDVKELATWVGSQTDLVFYETIRMNE